MFYKKAKEKSIIILGEIHGAKINPIIANQIVKKFGITTIMLELEEKWSIYFKNDLNNFIKFVKKSDNWIFKSGLIGREHIPYLKLWQKEGKKIIAIKVEDKNWNKAEKLTYKRIIKLADSKKEEKILLIVGNLHARKTTFCLKDDKVLKRFIPLGYLLRKRSISLNIKYNGGKIINFGVKKINNKHLVSIPKKESYVIKKSKDRYFDYNIFTKKAEPITKI